MYYICDIMLWISLIIAAFLVYLVIDFYIHNEWTKKVISKVNSIFDEALTIITITLPAWIKSLFDEE
jgi:hypothetical protein